MHPQPAETQTLGLEIWMSYLGQVMKDAKRIVIGSLLVGLAVLTAGCVVAPYREGYYDRDHHRYYHQNAWVTCGDNDEHCR